MTPTFTLQHAPRRDDGVAAVELDGETVLYTGDGTLYKLDGLATVLWQQFDGTRPLTDIVAGLVEVYPAADPADISDDVLAYVRELARSGLLTL